MPVTSRPREMTRNSTTERRPFRPFSDMKRSKGNGNGNARNARTAPPETTNAENFYYLKQMNSKTPMVVVLTDGEELAGWIEWYDKTCLKLNREGAPNLLIQKHCIKYLYKQDEIAE